MLSRVRAIVERRDPRDGPHRADAAVGDACSAASRRRAGRPPRPPRARRRRPRARGRRLLRDRARSGAGAGGDEITAALDDPDDRDRRRCRMRRPGARLARPARPLRRSRAALREAVRRLSPTRSRRARGVRRRRPRAPLPRGGAHVRDAGRRARGVRGGRRASSGPRDDSVRLQTAPELQHVRSTANAATITAASSTAPATPSHAQAIRDPQPDRDERQRPGDESGPITLIASRPCPASTPPEWNRRRRGARSPGRATTSESASGTAANAITWRGLPERQLATRCLRAPS